MSALQPKADMRIVGINVCQVPLADFHREISRANVTDSLSSDNAKQIIGTTPLLFNSEVPWWKAKDARRGPALITCHSLTRARDAYRLSSFERV